MPRPTHRHHRKAGSGPPAAALIAWIGADTNRYGTANGRREPDLRSPASTQPARAAAASVALVCGAVLAVTASVTEGGLGPLDATTAPVIPQASPDQAVSPVPAKQVDRDRAASPVPAAVLPPLIRQAPKSIPVPPATEPVAAKPVAIARVAVPPVTAPRAADPRVTTQPDASASRRPDVPQTSPSDRTSPSSQQGRGSSSGGLGSTVNRTAGSLGSALGLR